MSTSLVDTLIDTWTTSVTVNHTSAVIPDGCRDLIITCNDQNQFTSHISPLFNHTKNIASSAGTRLMGFRFKPGATINEKPLLLSLGTESLDTNQVLNRLDDYVTCDGNIFEAIACLSSDVSSIELAAKQLGVSQRSLQRQLLTKTARPPQYWLRLARVRRAARESLTTPFAELAGQHHYADQAHLCREIKHWFGMLMVNG